MLCSPPCIYGTWWCVDRFVNFIMQSWLLGKSFDGFIFGDNLRLCSHLVPEHRQKMVQCSVTGGPIC